MLNQVALAGALLQHIGYQLPGDIKLVITREDESAELLLLVALADEIAAEDFQPAIALPDFLPQVIGGEAERIGRIARAAGMAPVEGQENRVGAGQLGAHHHFRLTDGEMHQCPAGEGQQWFDVTTFRLRMTVETVLVDGIADALGEVGFEFGRGHGHAIDEQHQVHRLVGVVERVMHLAHHAQAIGFIGRLNGRVEAERRLELHQGQRLLETDHLDTPAQHFQRALFVEAFAHPLGQHPGQAGAVGFGQRLPGIRLGGLYPGEQVGQEQGVLAVVMGGIAFGV